MLRALIPSPGLDKGVPAMRARWQGHRVDAARLAEFLALTGLDAARGLPIIYPHVFGFPLVMAVLTHPTYPLPIWNALQIRNRLVQHAPISVDAALDFETEIAAHRILDKGIEIDLHTGVRDGAALVWESLNTFYYRGRYGTPQAPSPDAPSPDVGGVQVAAWRTRTGMGRRFGRFTGDYNGIHLWDWYARLFGFPRAFHHPQLVIGQCLAHLSAPGSTQQRLDTWLKGPVSYGSTVRLDTTPQSDRTVFALFADAERRPAIVARWSPGA